MTTQKEALCMALDALDALCINDYSGYELGKRDAHLVDNALTAIKKALAQPEPEWVGLTDEEARVKFESWHKAEYVQPLERYGHTYKNMHVRNRWQGWLAANGIKEKNT